MTIKNRTKTFQIVYKYTLSRYFTRFCKKWTFDQSKMNNMNMNITKNLVAKD